MFDEARRRRERGEDVVVAAAQPTMPPDVARPSAALEVIPTTGRRWRPGDRRRRRAARRPQVCLIDGLAYDNPPGSRHAKRYQDVEDCSTPASRCSRRSTSNTSPSSRTSSSGVRGKTRRETVPQEFIDRADEVVVVDAPPERRPGRRRAQQLSQLRQRALLLTADVVDRQLEALPASCTASSRRGARRSAFWCA